MSVQFTEAEMLMLSSLAYTNAIPKGCFDARGNPTGETISVEVILDGLDKLAKGDYYGSKGMTQLSQDNYNAALTSLKQKLIENDFVISKSINYNSPAESGLAAFAIEPRNNPDGDVIICCRGSDSMNLRNLNDWLGADAALAWKEQTKQQEELKLFMQEFYGYGNISLVGHSLGGNLAVYGALSFPTADQIAAVYSFDGPGFNPTFIQENLEKINELNEKIYNFQQEHDLVSSCLVSVGDVIILDSAIEYNGNVDFDNHQRWAIRVDPDGKLIREPSGQKDEFCSAVNDISLGAANLIDLVLWLMPGGNTLFNIKAIQTIREIFKRVNAGNRYTVYGTHIKIDTMKMDIYAKRLSTVNDRLYKLDKRLDKLYTKVGLFDLWNLLQADLLTGYSWRLNRCINYLNDTAYEFEEAERSISSQA